MSRRIKFQYHLLRNGAFCAYLRADKGSTPTIIMNDSGELKTSFTGVFAPEAVDADGAPVNINWLSDEIQPVMVVNGVQHKLGIFAVAKHKEVTRRRVKKIQVQAYDRCWRVRDTKRAQLLYWPAGTSYLTAINQLLTAAGVETIFSTPNAAVFTEDREDWGLGVSFLKVVNELLAEINYKPLYFDENGFAILEPVSLPTASDIRQLFDANDPDTLMLPVLERESDVYAAPNVFIVWCANPNKAGNMVATARNDNPQSPISVPRRGREITEVVSVNNIASQTELQNYANWLRDKSLISGETVKVETGLRHGFGVGDAVGLVYGELTAIGIEHAYTMELKVGGRMKHTIERVIYNLE